ncbi:MAG: hypothetical protein L7S44_04995, partial [Flavobacteriaceae bacterium]|nr:hypothetical protein [Flavobacteriaceae bacterium]
MSNFKLITDKISFFGCQSFILLSLLFFAVGFSLSAQTSPTVTLTDTDADNLLSASDTVTITATFSEAMVATPTISITGVVSDFMTPNPNVLSFSSATASNTSATVTNTYSGSNEGINFGTEVKISADGSTLVTNSHWGKTIYIYKKSNGGWNLKQKIHGSDTDTDGTYTSSSTVYSYWGVSFDISEDGNTIVVTHPKNIESSGSTYNNGDDDTIMIYEYSSSLDKYELTFETPEFSTSSPNSNTSFSIWDLSLSDDAGTLVGVRPKYSNTSALQVYVIDINNLGTNSISAVRRQLISFSAGVRLSRTDAQISGDGLTLAIKSSSGTIYIYTRADTSSNFSSAQQITHSHNGDYNSDLVINYDGEFIVWSHEAYGNDNNVYNPDFQAEEVIIYKRNSGSATWSQFGSTITDPLSDGSETSENLDVHFGRTIDISGNGKHLFVTSPAGAYFDYNVGTIYPAKVYSYKYTDSGFVYNSVVFNQTDYTRLSLDVSLSKTGEDFVIGNSPFLAKQGNNSVPDKVTFGDDKNSGYGGSVDIFKGIPTAYDYAWDVDNGNNTAPSDGTYYATVAGTASATSIAYSGTDSITFTLDTTAPTVTLIDTDSNNIVN